MNEKSKLLLIIISVSLLMLSIMCLYSWYLDLTIKSLSYWYFLIAIGLIDYGLIMLLSKTFTKSLGGN